MIARLRQRYTVPHEPLRSERRMELAVVVLALVVVLQLLILLGRHVAMGEIRAVPPAPDSLTVVAREQPRTLTAQQSREVLARPVFFASRRPLEPLVEIAAVDVAPKKKKVGRLKGLKVLGIVENGENSRVIVSFRGEQQRLLKGDSIEGWRLTEVKPGGVTLEGGDQRDERSLSPAPVIAAAPGGEVAGAAADNGADPASAAESGSGERRESQEGQGRQQRSVTESLSAGGVPVERG